MASGIEVGNGGVYLGAPPYLWFIENKGDKPGAFTKLLGGFGSQDTHETLNTFQWGPDGWLYGLHGIYTQSKVIPASAAGDAPGNAAPVELNAGLWRFHPKTKRFEVVSEGTSNPWGWDYRNTDGQAIAACCVIPHLFHLVPGGTYKRQGGQGFNPYAYGQINEICDHTFHKESGWAHAGLLSLDTPLVPEPYRNSVIFGSIHGCSVKRNTLKPNGSTFTASRADDFLQSGDKNVRPINLRWGPNGEILLIDWHDQNPCHQAEAGSWDYQRGRVYRIVQRGSLTKKPADLGAYTPSDLALKLGDPNPHVARTALRLLGERRGSLSIQVKDRLAGLRRPQQLEQLGLLDDATVLQVLDSRTISKPETRGEVARALGTRETLPLPLFAALAARAATEESQATRREYASLAVRFAKVLEALPLVHNLLRHGEDARDPAIPQLLWLAYEKTLPTHAQAEFDWLAANAADNALVTDQIVPRACRRLAASGKPEESAHAVAFIAKVADAAVSRRGLEGLAEGLKGRVADPPANWREVQVKLTTDADPRVRKLAESLAANFRDAVAVRRALTIVADMDQPPEARAAAARTLALNHPPEALDVLLSCVNRETNFVPMTEVLRALAQYDSPVVAAKVLARMSYFPPPLKEEAVNLLAGRRAWAKELIAAVAAGRVERTAVSASTVLKMRAFKDKVLDTAIEAGWGRLRDTPAELVKLIDTMRGELDKAPASFAKGKAVFEANCAKCHQFDGRGFHVGPALDGAGRDVEYILANVLDPNRAVGAPYFVRRVLLKSGRLEEGLLHTEDPQTITLKGENDAIKVITKADAESIEVSERSVMPEGLAYSMTTQDFRDLVRYLTASPAVADWTLSPTLPAPTDSPPAGRRVQLGASGKLEPRPDAAFGYAYATATFSTASALATKLTLGSNLPLRAWIDGKEVYVGTPGDGSRPDQASADVQLTKGDHRLVVEMKFVSTRATLYARILDPNRQLSHPEPEKKP